MMYLGMYFGFILLRFAQLLESVIWDFFLSIQGDHMETNLYKLLSIAIPCGADPQNPGDPWPVCKSRFYTFP